MAEPISLIVARARISGGVELDLEAPESLHARSGEPIVIKFPFRFDELSKDQEDYAVHLILKVDGVTVADIRRVERDRRMSNDDLRGLIHHPLTLPAGEHRLEFTASVEFVQGDWGGGPRTAQVQESVSSSVTVDCR